MKKTLTLSAMALALAACQGNLTFEERVEDRWAAIIDKDYERAFEYFSPGYKANESVESFQLRREKANINFDYIKAKFASKKCESSACEVKIKLTYTIDMKRNNMPKIENIETTITEQWVEIDSQWFLVPDETSKF